ncbi:hypothetical protein V6N13_125139 [Hibiscus sabdariffa]
MAVVFLTLSPILYRGTVVYWSPLAAYGYGFIYIFGRSPRVREIILIQSRALLSFLFCLGRESRQMSVSRQMSFLLISRSFHSELLQYNFLPLGPAAFGFYQGRSVPGRLSEITNKLATVPFYHKTCNI